MVLIGVSLYSLSSVATRTADISRSEVEAQANARMSLVMALGELQQLAGLDTRVTASSKIYNEEFPDLLGVWKSWEGLNSDASGKPIPPDYNLKNQAVDPDDPSVNGRFISWLVSGAEVGQNFTNPDSLLYKDPKDIPDGVDTIPLLSEGSVDRPPDYPNVPLREIHVPLQELDQNGDNLPEGAYAWWISGDNQKAMLNVDPEEEPSTTVDWHTRTKSNGRADVQSFGLERLDDQPKLPSIPSIASLELIGAPAAAGRAATRNFHNITVFNRGLLTNTATGGWRKDLSLFSENFDDLPETGLPTLNLGPGEIQTGSKAQNVSRPGPSLPNTLIYPWANYRRHMNTRPWQQVPPICSWTALTDFMLQYRYLTTSSSVRTAMPFRADTFDRSILRFGYQDQVRRSPVIARIQWIFSFCSRLDPDQEDPNRPYQAALLITPVVTLWNPYNVELELWDGFRFTFDQIAPISFTFKVGDVEYPEVDLFTIIGENGQSSFRNFRMDIVGSITLAPGATRIFGINNPVPVQNPIAADGGSSNIILEPGYQPNGGLMFYGIDEGNKVLGAAGDTFTVVDYGYSGKTQQGTNTQGLGIYMEFWPNRGSNNYNGYRTIYDETVLGGDSVVDALYPTPNNPISATLGAVEGSNNQPFVTAILGWRPATPRPDDSRFSILHTKGMLNTHPLQYYSELGEKASDVRDRLEGTGSFHPINAPFDFSFLELDNGWGSEAIPQFESDNSTYILTGMLPSDGLTRCVLAELPTRPLQSLAELQHFDARNNNPFPPFQFNLIGNSSANPIFAPDQITINKLNQGEFMSNDDTYILNQLLFDDWFVSSIAPDLNDFSRTERRSIEQVYEEHLSSDARLPNRFYLPAAGADPNFPVASGVQDPDTGMYPYETVASQLEVEGMINVNSTSVEAWTAWLSQGRNARVPYLDDSGATELDDEQSFAFPRTSIAGDRVADSGLDEFSGYRALTDSQVEALAEEIVEEIKIRGPMLSLAEFVNRRLTSDKALAAAGVIQQALDTLAEDSSAARNPFKAMQDNSFEITNLPPGPTDYKFPEAAQGSTAFGLPGWVRQADILTRLAPMMSVRDDTFTIRAYGDARGRDGSIVARAWCEATVVRRADFVDTQDPSQLSPHSSEIESDLNRRFGRGFELVSFRWLDPEEI